LASIAAYRLSSVRARLGAVAFGLALFGFIERTKTLGGNWSVTLEIRQDHTLVTTGIYRRLGCPMYSAFWLWRRCFYRPTASPDRRAGSISASCFRPHWARGALDDRDFWR
jgi:protein-S-isoprenylcysteine O-methyltransferase Ste14